MASATEYRRTECFDLRQIVNKFIVDNASSQSVDKRWLANALRPWVEYIERIEDGSLTPDLAHRVREFRLSEIEAERAKRQDEIRRLEEEARKLHGQAKVA